MLHLTNVTLKYRQSRKQIKRMKKKLNNKMPCIFFPALIINSQTLKKKYYVVNFLPIIIFINFFKQFR